MVGAKSVSLGTLRLDLTVGYKDFIKGLQQVNQALIDFKKNLAVSTTKTGKILRYGIFPKSFFTNVEKANEALINLKNNLSEIAQLSAQTGLGKATSDLVELQQAANKLKDIPKWVAPSGKAFKLMYRSQGAAVAGFRRMQAEAAKFGQALTANIKTDELGRWIVEMQNVGKAIATTMTIGGRKFPMLVGSIEDAIKVTDDLNKYFKTIGVDASVSFTQIDEAGKQYQIRIGSMRKATDDSIKGTLKQILSFKSMFAKIMHYVTFSIGVQSVMAIRNAIKSLIDTMLEFQSSAINAATVSGYLYASFDNVTNQIMSMSRYLARNSVYSVTDITKAFYSLASAGYDVNLITKDMQKGMKILGPIIKYATATGVELDFALQSIVKTTKQFNYNIEETEKVTDTFLAVITRTFATAEKLAEGFKYVGSISGVLGQDLGDVASALGILYDRGLEGGQAGQRLNMIFTKLLKPTDKARDMLEGMGLSLVAYLSDQVKLSGGITEEVASKQMESLSNQLKVLNNRITDLGLSAQGFLIPLLSGVADIINKLLPVIGFLGNSLVKIGSGALLAGIAFKSMTGIMSETTRNMLALEGVTLSYTKILKSSMIRVFLLYTALEGISNIIKGPVGNALKKITPLIIAVYISMRFLNKEFISATINAIAQSKAVTILTTKIGALTASIHSLSTAMKGVTTLTVIGIILVALSLLVEYWDQITAAVNNFFGIESKTVKLEKEAVNAIDEYNKVSVDYLNTTRELVDTRQKMMDLETKLTEMREKNLDNTREYKELVKDLTKSYNDYIDLEEKLRETQQQLLDSTTAIIVSLRKMDDTLDEALVYHGDIVSITEDLRINNESLKNAEEDRRKAEEKLNETIALYGVNSKEALGAMDELNKASVTYQELEQKGIELNSNLNDARENELETLKKLDEKYKDFYHLGKTILDSRAKILSFERERDKLRAKELVLQRHLNETGKLYEERLKNIWEQQLKVYDAELSLYKLRKDSPKVIEDLFDALAKYGLLNDELIEKYKELEIARGELMKTEIKFFDVYSDLTDEQKKQVMDLLKTYEELLSEGLDPVTAWYEAQSRLGIDLSQWGLSDADIKAIEDYGFAEWNVTRITKEFGDELERILGPLGDLENLDLPSDVKEALTDWLKLTGQLVEAENKYKEALKGVADGWKGIMDVAVYAWRALQDTADESIVDTWRDMVNQSESLQHAITLNGGALEMLKRLFPDELAGVNSLSQALDKLGESAVIATIGYIQLADQLGLPLSDLGSMESLIENIKGLMPGLNVDFEDTTDYVSSMLDSVDSMYDVMEKLNITIGKLNESLATLTALFDIQIQGGFQGWLKQFDNAYEASGALFKTWAEATGRLEDINFDEYIETDQAKEDIDNFVNWLYYTLTPDQALEITMEIPNLIPNYNQFTSDIQSIMTWMNSNPDLQPALLLTLDTNAFKKEFKNNLPALQNWINSQDKISEDIISKIDGYDWVKVETWAADKQVALQSALDEQGNLIKDIEVRLKPEVEEKEEKGVIENITDFFGGIAEWYRKSSLHIFNPEDYTGEFENWLSGIKKKKQKGDIVSKPTYALIGEAGPEAIIPLSGKNKKYGESILSHVIPRYFPELTMQTGGIIGTLPITKPTSIARILSDIYDLLKSGIKVIIDSTNLTTPIPINPIVPPRPGVPVPVTAPTGEIPVTGATQGGLFSSTVEVRQGGKKINVEIYIDANLFNTAIQSFIDTLNEQIPNIDNTTANMINALNSFSGTLSLFNIKVGLFYTIVKSAADTFKKAVDDVTPIVVKHDVTVHHSWENPFGLQQGGVVTKPTYALFGEAGPEAIIPLAGVNKKYGEKILSYIIPKYFPEMTFQTGAIYEGTKVVNENYEEKYNVLGPVYITANNIEDFSKSLKYRYRMSGGV